MSGRPLTTCHQQVLPPQSCRNDVVTDFPTAELIRDVRDINTLTGKSEVTSNNHRSPDSVHANDPQPAVRLH